MNTSSHTKPLRGLGIAALVILQFALAAHGGSFPEPATVFYGRVLATGSERPYLVTTGQLHWTIRRADGLDVRLRTSLWPLNGGELSYRLDVPHDALASGIDSSTSSVPLRVTEDLHTHLRITMDGMTARILGPAGRSSTPPRPCGPPPVVWILKCR